MADAMTLAKLPVEKLGDFNKRLRQACTEQDVTDAQIIVVDGEPVVTLFSAMIEATQEEVDEGDADKIGELICENEPVLAQVSKVSCDNDEAAKRTQAHMETVYSRADGTVVEQLHASGFRAGFIQDPDKRYHYVQQPVNYILVSYLKDGDEDADDGDDGEDGAADAGMEARLREPAATKR